MPLYQSRQNSTGRASRKICGEKHLPGIPDTIGTFCCCDEHHDQGSSKRKGVSWLWFPMVRLRGTGANRTYSARSGSWLPSSQPRACSREGKLEVDEDFYSKPIPNDILSPARLCGWNLSLNSTVNWGPGSQTADTMGDISHQNPITWDWFPKLSFKKPDVVAGICNPRPNTSTVRWKADRIGLKLTQDRTAQNAASK